MNDVEALFAPVLNQLTWGVSKGYGALHIEFGRPHAQVREPFVSRGDSPKVKELAARRQIFIHGEWSLLVISSFWSVESLDKKCESEDEREHMDKVLHLIDGQRLSGVQFQLSNPVLILRFDMGGVINLVEDVPKEHILLLSDYNRGEIYGCNHQGMVSASPQDRYEPGSINTINRGRSGGRK
jgi:hypothetical protein